jgi:hypothetical protein
MKPLSFRRLIFTVFGMVGVISLIFLTHCTPEHQQPTPVEADYFPLRVGLTNHYQRILTKFQVIGTKVDTLKDTIFVRETLKRSLKDVQGNEQYYLEIDSSRQRNADFKPFRSGLMYKYRNECLRTEETLTKVVIYYPVNKGTIWNGNKYNNQGIADFRYIKTGFIFNNFENCVQVEQLAEDPTFIQDRYEYEIYAPNIGKVKRYERNLQFISTDPNKPSVLDPKSYIYEDVWIP